MLSISKLLHFSRRTSIQNFSLRGASVQTNLYWATEAAEICRFLEKRIGNNLIGKSGISRFCAPLSAASTYLRSNTRQSAQIHYLRASSCAWQLIQRKTNATRIRAINSRVQPGRGALEFVAMNWPQKHMNSLVTDVNVIAELANNFTQHHALTRRHLRRQLNVFGPLTTPRADSRGESICICTRFDFCHF